MCEFIGAAMVNCNHTLTLSIFKVMPVSKGHRTMTCSRPIFLDICFAKDGVHILKKKCPFMFLYDLIEHTSGGEQLRACERRSPVIKVLRPILLISVLVSLIEIWANCLGNLDGAFSKS